MAREAATDVEPTAITLDDGTQAAFLLTSDAGWLRERLAALGCRPVSSSDWAYWPALPDAVRDVMTEKSACYALPAVELPDAVFFYKKGRGVWGIALEMLRPFSRDGVEVRVGGRPYTYFMTNDAALLQEKLASLGYRKPAPGDWKKNPALSQRVIVKMEELHASYSLTLDGLRGVLNYCRTGRVPLILYLDDLCPPQKERLPPDSAVTPLMLAAGQNDAARVRDLVALGADVNFADRNGVTALMYAAVKGATDAVRALLESHADVNARTSNGNCAFLLAIVSDACSKELLQLLRDYGAEVSLPVRGYSLGEKVPFHDKFEYYLRLYSLRTKEKPSAVYRAVGMSKQTFAKLRTTSRPNFHPRKNNVLLLAIGMRLPLGEAEDLLASAGYAFAPDSAVDSTVREFIRKGDYCIDRIEEALYRATGGAQTLLNYGKDGG